MKGKGKAAQQQQQQQQDKECPLQFPDLSIVNHEEDCKLYTAVLTRPATESVNLEELDWLQSDLTVLLASVGRRLKLLQSEIQILQDWQDKKDVKTPITKGKVQPEPSSAKRGKAASASATVDERPIKKFKESTGKAIVAATSAASPAPRSKSKLPGAKGLEAEAVHSPAELPQRLVKNECVDRFWTAVEGYCRPVTDEDLRFLEEQIARAEEEESTFFKVPPLGRHYKQVWADEDLAEEVNEGSKANDKKRLNNHNPSSTSNGTNGMAEPSSFFKKADISMESPFGPLTERLVAAFIEDGLLKQMDDVITDFEGCTEEAPAISPRTLAKQLNISNPAALERRIQRELQEQGILDLAEEEEEEGAEDDPNDEVLAELKAAQARLKPMLQWKLEHLRELLQRAKDQQARHAQIKKFEECDAKLQEEYRKLNAGRQKKKPNLKKERESVKKVLKEWTSLYETLDDPASSQ